MAAGLGSVIGTAINLGGYRAMGGFTSFAYSMKVRALPVMGMALFAQKNVEALATGDVSVAPQARLASYFITPYVQSQLRAGAARDKRGGKERGLFYSK
jgi:hypothetical protein